MCCRCRNGVGITDDELAGDLLGQRYIGFTFTNEAERVIKRLGRGGRVPGLMPRPPET